MNNAEHLEDSLLDELVKFQDQNPEVCIGGSIALMLQKAIPYRKPKDVDVITTTVVSITELKGLSRLKDKDGINQYVIGGLKCDVLRSPVSIQPVDYKHSSGLIKLYPVNELAVWKKEAVDRLPHALTIPKEFAGDLVQRLQKHKEDLDHINNNIK